MEDNMKRILGMLFTLTIFSIVSINCASFSTDPKKMACKRACDSNYDSCIEKAKDAKAKGICEAEKIACHKGCDEM